MGTEIVYCSFLPLLFVMLALGNAAGDANIDGVNVLRLPSSTSMDLKEGGMGMGMGMDQAEKDPGFKVFYLMKDIQVGKTIPVCFPHITESDPSRRQLPRKTPYHDHHHQLIPFSLKALPSILRFFSIPPGSPQALTMENTLRACETPRHGEFQTCISSVDSLVDVVTDLFGSDTRIEIVRPSLTATSTPLIQNYSVVEVKEKVGVNTLPCHYLPYAYPVFICHIDMHSKNRMFKVLLRGENGDLVDTILLCHMNTSEWNPKFYAFRQLGGIKPGMSEACHFFPLYDLLALLNHK